MAKAVVPVDAFRERFGDLQNADITGKLQEMVMQFLHEHASAERKRETVKA
jgi:hypothetical protein